MEIEYYNINLYLELFDTLQDLGLLPEYQNISIIVANDYTTLVYFNGTESISTDKLKRILFKKYPRKIMPPHYDPNLFDQVIELLNNGIEDKYALWKDDINYEDNTLIKNQNEKYKLARIFYLSYEIPISKNINKIELIHYNKFLQENNIKSHKEILDVKNNYINQISVIKNTIKQYNSGIRKLRRIRRKILSKP